MRPEINLGPLTLHAYGLIIALAIYVGLELAKKRAKIYKIDKKRFEDIALVIPLILAIVGARLYHVMDYWQLYSENPITIVHIANGGLGIWGGLSGAILGFFILSKIKKINFLTVCDLAAPSLLLGQAIGRFGNYFNQEGFGPPTELPWGVNISLNNRPEQFLEFSKFHPTFFYEAIINVLFLTILLLLEKKSLKRGQLFALYLIFYAIGRFTVEFWRIDTATIGQIKVAQILCLFSFVIGSCLFVATKRSRL